MRQLYVHVNDINPLLYEGLTIETFLPLLQIYINDLSWVAYLSVATETKSYLAIDSVIENYDVLPLLKRVAEIHRETITNETNIAR